MGVKVQFWKRAWWVVVHLDGRRKKKRVGDRETAGRVARAIREKLALGEFNLAATPDAPSFRSYAEQWLATMKATLKASTWSFYETNLVRYIYPALGLRPVTAIRRQDCRDLITTCRAKGLGVATVRGILRTLSTVLSQALEDDLLPANLAFRLGRYLRSADDPEKAPNPLTRDEVAAVLAPLIEEKTETGSGSPRLGNYLFD